MNSDYHAIGCIQSSWSYYEIIFWQFLIKIHEAMNLIFWDELIFNCRDLNISLIIRFDVLCDMVDG